MRNITAFFLLMALSGCGFVFQNFVYLMLKEMVLGTASTIHYWRTKEGAEVDFLINTGKETLPIQVKYQDLSLPVIPRSMASYIEKYQPPQAYIVNLSLNAQTMRHGTDVHFVDCFRLLENL